MTKEKLEPATLATREAKELERLRNSISFKLGVAITNFVKKPWRIFLFPLVISSVIKIFSQSKVKIEAPKDDGILIIGIDTKGFYHAKLAHRLRLEIKDFENLHFISTPIEEHFLENFSIIPGPRNMKTKNPKSWNMMIERYVSTYIANNSIGKVILVSDYPFQGIIDVLVLNEHVSGCWIKTTLPHELEKQTNHAQSTFDLVIDSDRIALSVVARHTDKLPLQKREGRKNVVIDLPGKLERKSDDLSKDIRNILEENFETDNYQITYGEDKEIERTIPNKFSGKIDWDSVDLIICDGSIRSQRIIDNSDCHVICIPNKKFIRDRQIERFNKKGLEDDIIILSDPHKLAIIDALEHLLIIRPSTGDNRRNRTTNSDITSSLNELVEWIK